MYSSIYYVTMLNMSYLSPFGLLCLDRCIPDLTMCHHIPVTCNRCVVTGNRCIVTGNRRVVTGTGIPFIHSQELVLSVKCLWLIFYIMLKHLQNFKMEFHTL